MNVPIKVSTYLGLLLIATDSVISAWSILGGNIKKVPYIHPKARYNKYHEQKFALERYYEML